MSRIIVDEYPSEAKDCPLAKYKQIEGAYGFYDRYKCKCSGELCCISDSIFDYDTIDGNIKAYTELVEEYGYNKQAYCKDYCPFLQDFNSIFTIRS